MNTKIEFPIATGSFGASVPLAARWCDAPQADVDASSMPLLVFIHGGGYDERYFDVGGRSVIQQAAAAGFGTVALTRPGYPTNDSIAADHPGFAKSAEILDEAIADAWQQLGSGRPGVVLVTHSVGSAIGIHLAARQVSFPLLGLATSAIADVLAPAAQGVVSSFPPSICVDLPFAAMRGLLFGPDWTVASEVLEAGADYLVRCPTNEVHELAQNWPTDLKNLAPHVSIPVQYVLAEFDGMWPSSQDAVDRMAAYFTGTPFVDAKLWRGTGHNIELHTMGRTYVNVVLAFAERCVMETHRVIA
ncbi:MAG: alpha/beta hydrolase [Rhodococcus sp. (in: high G+C Gram-positive bacteria)]|uniref:alpha/beta hydrolase n=1 Tax=Rhodococcus sp. TaxID=1831 RepID=UPI002AD69723|nr:alpha/beta hydrolase [Rhodococcus sp. (in: high G+C Gram-positive bacteria)]